MANNDYPHGLNAVMSRFHDTPRMSQYKAYINTTTPAAIFRGDVVQLLATGDVRSVVTAAGVDGMIGVAASYVPAVAANDQADIWVHDDMDTVYEIQSDGTTDPGATTAQAHIGQTADIALTAGNAGSGQSGHELDYSDLGVTATAPLKVVGHYEITGNDMALMHARYLVVLNKSIQEKRKAV